MFVGHHDERNLSQAVDTSHGWEKRFFQKHGVGTQAEDQTSPQIT